MKADFHMHSSFSSDAEFEPEAMIQEAIRRGLQTICFTDHQDKDYQGGSLSFTFDSDNAETSAGISREDRCADRCRTGTSAAPWRVL